MGCGLRKDRIRSKSVLLTLVAVWKIDERGVYGCRETGEDPKSHASRASRASSDKPAFVMCSS